MILSKAVYLFMITIISESRSAHTYTSAVPISYSSLSPAEKSFFKNSSEIEVMARRLGSPSTRNDHTLVQPNPQRAMPARLKRYNYFGCGTIISRITYGMGQSIRYEGRVYELCYIHDGHDQWLFQAILVISCASDRCCNGRGSCGLRKRPVNLCYIDYSPYGHRYMIFKEFYLGELCQCHNFR